MLGYSIQSSYFGAILFVDVCGTEVQYYVQEENEIDQVVYNLEPYSLEGYWLKTNVYRYYKHIENGEYHDKQVPLCLSVIVDAQNPRIFSFLLAI